MQSTRVSNNPHELKRIEVTYDTLTGRAGLSLFVRYLESVGINPLLDRLFGALRKSRKGLPVIEIFKQVFVFLLDGTSRHLCYFDTLKEDSGHAGVVESKSEDLLSSHTAKRFFKSFSLPKIHLFRKLLRELFLWRLRLSAPEIVILGLDSMVMDNDGAKKRHGVTPTYKKVKGFQPLHLTWERHIVDAIFRRDERHCNHGNDVNKLIRQTVKLIRKHYRENVPILLRLDSGFFDTKIFTTCEDLGIGFVCGGKLYDDIQGKAREHPKNDWSVFERKPQSWRYFEFKDKRRRWRRTRRAIYCQPLYEDQQRLLEFARPDTILYTNIGQEQEIDDLLSQANHSEMLKAARLISFYHRRGADELIHRELKDFAAEQLPFKRFGPNMAYFYTILVAFFLYGTFKEDVSKEVIPIEVYPTTFRRRLIDQAGKIVRHAGEVVLKVVQAVWNALRIPNLWRKAHHPPRISPLLIPLHHQNRST